MAPTVQGRKRGGPFPHTPATPVGLNSPPGPALGRASTALKPRREYAGIRAGLTHVGVLPTPGFLTPQKKPQ